MCRELFLDERLWPFFVSRLHFDPRPSSPITRSSHQWKCKAMKARIARSDANGASGPTLKSIIGIWFSTWASIKNKSINYSSGTQSVLVLSTNKRTLHFSPNGELACLPAWPKNQQGLWVILNQIHAVNYGTRTLTAFPRFVKGTRWHVSSFLIRSSGIRVQPMALRLIVTLGLITASAVGTLLSSTLLRSWNTCRSTI